MTKDERGIDLVERWRQGDEEAATMLYGRYVERMMSVIGRQIPSGMVARIDAEDVAQSVFRTVFRRMQNGEFEFRDDGDLWKLLVTIALNKARSQVGRNLAARRSVNREARNSDAPIDEAMAKRLQLQPSITDALAFRDTLNLVFGRLNSDDAELIQLRLEGYSQQEIADRLQVTPRTIRRRLTSIRKSVAGILDEETPDPPKSD